MKWNWSWAVIVFVLLVALTHQTVAYFYVDSERDVLRERVAEQNVQVWELLSELGSGDLWGVKEDTSITNGFFRVKMNLHGLDTFPVVIACTLHIGSARDTVTNENPAK